MTLTFSVSEVTNLPKPAIHMPHDGKVAETTLGLEDTALHSVAPKPRRVNKPGGHVSPGDAGLKNHQKD